MNDLLFLLKIFIRRTVYLSLFILDTYILQKSIKVFVLCYHGIGNDNWRFSISYEMLREQIEYLMQHYTPIALEDVKLYVQGKNVITKPSFVITFDDGYKDLLTIKEFFKKKAIKPTLFLLSDIKHANRKELGNNRKFLTKRDVFDLIRNGWTIGSHSATHADFYQLTEKQIIEEVVASKEDLERRHDIPIQYFAYPRGRYTNKILSAVKRADFSLGLTMDDDFITTKTNQLLIPRIGVDRTHSYAEFKTLYSPSVMRVRGFIKKRLGVII